MTNLGLTIFLSLFVTSTFFSQQLIINEVSQGSGSSEYVEFVVVGSATCIIPVPCIDLRKVIIDDNNGYFAPGSGTGIAAGAIRFADDVFWSCVPQGTYIVIYNESSPNTSLPPDDISLTDGNCSLIIPASSNLLEITTVSSPSISTNLYPSDVSWIIGGSWAPLAMSNTNDSFQIPNLAVNGTPLHAVSWGNNSNGSIIYFTGSATMKVFSFVNTVSNDWNNQLNWIAGDVGVNETPGFANNSENDAWIGSMNPQCGIPTPIILSETVLNETCKDVCDGSVSIAILNGISPYSFLWENGETTQSISNLCEGIYTVEVRDFGGCLGTIDITILEGTETGDATILESGPYTTVDLPSQLSTVTSDGIWTSDCGGCLSNSGVFSPQISGQGTFQVCYKTGTGICVDNDCITLIVTENCVPQITEESLTICKEDSILIFSNWENTEGNYSQLFSDMNFCDSTHTIELSLFSGSPIVENLMLCENDSINIFGNWINNEGIYTNEEIDIHGCLFTHSVTILKENCEKEPFVIYIPNSFTPNGDGINDVFKIEILGGMVQSGYVMNRWGNEIASFNENKISWDGRNKKGEMVEDGVYIYVINSLSFEEKKDVKRGFIAIIR